MNVCHSHHPASVNANSLLSVSLNWHLALCRNTPHESPQKRLALYSTMGSVNGGTAAGGNVKTCRLMPNTQSWISRRKPARTVSEKSMYRWLSVSSSRSETLTKLLCVLSKVEKTPGRLWSYSQPVVCCDPVGGRGGGRVVALAETTLTRHWEKKKKNVKKTGLLEEKLQGSPRHTAVTAAQQLDRLALGAVWVKAAWIQMPAAHLKNNPLTVAVTLEAL